VETARAAVAKAGARLGLGVEETVVALAGPTGAGKSSLLNAVAGEELTAAGRRRPTTAAATAAVWGEGGEALLDWLEIPRRHRLAGGELDGLVLLDLPDFDSVERDHRLEVDRLVELVDLVVWVVDPQKYGDAAWHDDYVRRLAAYGESMAVVLNQADLLDPDSLEACRADLARLLAEDRERNPSHYAVLALSEGASFIGGQVMEYGQEDAYGHKKLGGVGQITGEAIKRITGIDIVYQPLAYLMRAGAPDSLDRMVAISYGNLAVEQLIQGHSGRMVALQEGQYTTVPIETCVQGVKRVDVAELYDADAYRPTVRHVLGKPMFLY